MMLECEFAPKQTHWRLGLVPNGQHMPQQAMWMFQIPDDHQYQQTGAASDENARNMD